MAIQQTKKQSDLEKRLRLLHQQVYGRSEVSQIRLPADQPTSQSTDKFTLRSDISYLYQDLLKISILAFLAIGSQISLYFLSQKHLLNLVFR